MFAVDDLEGMLSAAVAVLIVDSWMIDGRVGDRVVTENLMGKSAKMSNMLLSICMHGVKVTSSTSSTTLVVCRWR